MAKEYILGVESTAHTFGIGVVRDGKVFANVRDMYTTEKGGIIPIDSAKHHREVCDKLLNEAFEKAGIKEEDIKAIAFSQGPGLAPCLLAGKEFTKKLAVKLNVPVIPVNHCIAHLEIGRITGATDPVLLYASGANTQIIAYAAGKYRVFGETLDLGVGNFIDTFARNAGIGFPGGPKIAAFADKASEETKKNLIELPYSIKGMDVSFSGIQTKLKQMLDSKKYTIEDLSYSMQEHVFAMLIEASERALAHTGKKELLLGGGVACNKRLQEMARIMCEERVCKMFVPEIQFLIDNAGMIAYLGEIMFNSGIKISVESEDFKNLDINPRERTDDVGVSWK
jgi:N6-L-threonylcarbamoyladenine synthase